jgi:uncharacterized protein DUF3579
MPQLATRAEPIARRSEAPQPNVCEFVIQGLTRDGTPFRPSDWAERLCGVMAAFGGDHRMQYSPFVHPVTANGVRCVVVDVRLEEIEPMAYRFLVSFAKDNELRVREGRVEERTKLAELQRVGDTA